jgi:hypothetical protein
VNHATIRLQNLHVLDKIAANPAFVTPLLSEKGKESSAENQAGWYTAALSAIRKSVPMIGLKYQLHLDEANLAHYSPVLVTPAWEIIEEQATAIVRFGLNPAFAASWKPSITLMNVVMLSLWAQRRRGERGNRSAR